MESLRRSLGWWVCALAISTAALGLAHFRSRDPDSELYARIAADLAERPVRSWIAPMWPKGAYVEGLFQDHPAGLFLAPALLARLGYPALQASYAVGLFYTAATFAVLPGALGAFAPQEGPLLASFCQLLPIFFVFRVRANHEPAVALFLLLSIWGAERVWRGFRGGLLVLVASLAALMLVKGFFAFPAALCALLFLYVRARAHGVPPGPLLVRALLSLSAALAAVALCYEGLYRDVTGESFLQGYVQRSFRLGEGGEGPWSPAIVPYNLLFYCGRILWFAFPWSLVFLAAAFQKARAGRLFPSIDPKAQGLVFALGSCVIYVGLFSLSGRRAERYIFPVYLLVGALGLVDGLDRWPWLRRAASRLEAARSALPALVWLALFGFHLASMRLALPRVKVWHP